MADYKFKLISESGRKIYSNNLEDGLKSSDLSKNKNLIKIFDFLNTNKNSEGKLILDESELEKFITDIDNLAGSDNVLDPDEIKQYISDNKLGDLIKFADITELVNKIISLRSTNNLTDNIEGFGTNLHINKNINKINPEDITSTLNLFNSKNNESLIQAISNEAGLLGTIRNKYLMTICYKLCERAKQLNVPTSEFVLQFKAEVANMDITWGLTQDASKLDNILDSFLNKISKPEKIYNENKSGILQIMSDDTLCRTSDDKEKIIESIMKYSSLNNPKSFLESVLASEHTSPQIKSASNKLLASKYLDYYPIFVASIISQESQFREFDKEVFSENGQGVMQVTGTLIDDIYHHPSRFDDDFIKRNTKYIENNSLGKAIRDKKDASINYDVGTAGLKVKLDYTLKKLKNGTYKDIGINTASPESILQLVALSYNGNDAPKKDPKFANKLSQVRYVYSRNVIQRFKKYTPENIKVNHYFEYNPTTKKFLNH